MFKTSNFFNTYENNKYECCQHCNTNMIFLYYQQQALILVHTHTQENINLLKTTSPTVKDKNKNLIMRSNLEEKENVFKLHLRYS